MNRLTSFLNNGLLRFLSSFWAFITMALFIVEFFYLQKSDTIANLASIIYIAILGLYVSNKEYNRWSSKNSKTKFWGEYFILLWTLLVFLIIIFALGKNLKLPEGLIGTYVAILSIFVLTKESKYLYHRKRFKK